MATARLDQAATDTTTSSTGKAYMTFRHGYVEVVVPGGDGKCVVMQPGEGGGQSEPNIAQMFSQAYDTALKAWAEVRDTDNADLWVWCPFTERWVDASAHAYADDVAEHIARGKLLERAHTSGQILDTIINPCGLFRNSGKKRSCYSSSAGADLH